MGFVVLDWKGVGRRDTMCIARPQPEVSTSIQVDQTIVDRLGPALCLQEILVLHAITASRVGCAEKPIARW